MYKHGLDGQVEGWLGGVWLTPTHTLNIPLHGEANIKGQGGWADKIDP